MPWLRSETETAPILFFATRHCQHDLDLWQCDAIWSPQAAEFYLLNVFSSVHNTDGPFHSNDSTALTGPLTVATVLGVSLNYSAASGIFVTAVVHWCLDEVQKYHGKLKSIYACLKN